MGENVVGIVHPCKIYAILETGWPFIYIGPSNSHVSDIIRDASIGYSFCHGESGKVAEAILAIKKLKDSSLDEIGSRSKTVLRKFIPERLISKVADVVTAMPSKK